MSQRFRNSHSRTSRVVPEVALRIYRLLKDNPKRIFLARDLYLNKKENSSFNLLRKLEIIEEVDYYVPTRKTNGGTYRRKFTGYRLKRQPC